MDLEKLIDQLTKLENSVSGLLEPSPCDLTVENFKPRDGLQDVTSLSLGAPDDPALPGLALRQLAPYFTAGLLLQRRAWRGVNQWCLTETVVANKHQAWPPERQLDFSGLVIQVPPDQVRRAKAIHFLPLIPEGLNIPTQDTHAYLMMPAPETAYIWFSQTPHLWSEAEMRHTLKLINQAFTP